ncbi:hypothetical protein ACFL0T_08525, partial [Candidatus Omnitrophota bacterium]
HYGIILIARYGINYIVEVQESNLSAWDNLLATRDPAIQELKRLALESSNDVVRLKGIDMILELVGIRYRDKLPLLDPAGMQDSLERLGIWLNKRLVRTYQEQAPKVVFEYSSKEDNYPSFNLDGEALQRLDDVVKRMAALNCELLEGDE